MHKEDQGHGFFYPFVFPFYQKQWFGKTWWLAVLALIPIVDLILLKGWRFVLVQRMAVSEEQILPNADIGAFFKYGCVLWFMSIVYLIIPTIIIFSFGAGELGNLFSALKCLWVSVFGSSADASLYRCLKTEAEELVTRVIIEFIWLIVAAPLYRVAMIRYAISGNKRVFLNLPVNAFIVLRHLKYFIMMWVFGLVMTAALVLVTMVMVATAVLIPLIPLVVLLVYYYTTGYEYGHLAHDLVELKKSSSDTKETSV
ncbi:MAG: hypothetical protein ACI93R_001666 [Flavobacteriales bacterium]|jgi:hypothetical protein